ncbi:MAG: hypothetical protein ACJAS9_001569 [Polaribacter sp.]|jgi:hypothetical protein
MIYIFRFKGKVRAMIFSLLSVFGVTSCGDFPEYTFIQSNDYCAMSFPFAGGVIGRQYVGYFRVISSLQYMDENPSVRIIINGPSHIDLEVGSVQKFFINEQTYKPKYISSHVEGQLQLWGPAFLFTDEESKEIFKFITDGEDFKFIGRVEVGHQYETDVYNFFYDSESEPFRECINRLLEPEDLVKLGIEG